MKKIFALILTLAMVFSLAAVPAFAANIESATGSESHDVKATYNAGASGTVVYSVTIAWGEMKFEYEDGAWNPETHEFDNANWAPTGNTVTVTNHSNAAITAKLTYTAEGDYSNITGTFINSDTLNLNSAVGTPANGAPTANATLKLSGALKNNTPADTTVGKVTVSLD